MGVKGYPILSALVHPVYHVLCRLHSGCRWRRHALREYTRRIGQLWSCAPHGPQDAARDLTESFCMRGLCLFFSHSCDSILVIDFGMAVVVRERCRRWSDIMRDTHCMIWGKSCGAMRPRSSRSSSASTLCRDIFRVGRDETLGRFGVVDHRSVYARPQLFIAATLRPFSQLECALRLSETQ